MRLTNAPLIGDSHKHYEVQQAAETKQPVTYISKKQLAVKLGKSVRSINYYIQKGYIPARRLGNRIIFLESEVIESLKQIPTRPEAEVA